MLDGVISPSLRFALVALFALPWTFAMAQESAPAKEATATKEAAPPAEKKKEKWRDTSAYPFPALAATVAGAQNMAQAMILREYCADDKIPDEFVRARLALFSKITGREEDCASLLDY